MEPNEILGREISVVIDRPLGSFHPRKRGMRYPLNYGYVPGVLAGDGAEQDVYLLGVPMPVGEYTGVVVGIVRRRDDVEDKWIVALKGMTFSKDEMEKAVYFQEQFFDSELICSESAPEKKPVVGVSLSPEILLEKDSSPAGAALLTETGGAKKLLAALREEGAGSIELRTVRPGDSPFAVEEAACRVWEQGLSLTVHTVLQPGALGRAQIYLALWKLLETCPQPELTLVVHSLRDADEEKAKAETAFALHDLAAVLPENVQLALELNRKKGNSDPGHTPEALLEIWERAQVPKLGFCWDFGHYYYNTAYVQKTPEELPPVEFLRRTVHTHIHTLHEKATHFPLNQGELPLAAYGKALRDSGYRGVWNLELEPERFYHETSLWEDYRASLGMMREIL